MTNSRGLLFMKTITLVVNDRPTYLEQTLEALRLCCLDDYTMFIGVEPGNADVLTMCRSITFMRTVVCVNSRRLGVSDNPLETIRRAFAAGSQLNVALEDDVVLAPDALHLCNWFETLDASDALCLCLFTYGSDSTKPREVVARSHFTPLGWCTTRGMWSNRIEPKWMCDPRGWDFSINKILADSPGMYVLQPLWSRSNHIGRIGGTHCTPEYHDQTFARLEISDGRETVYTRLFSDE